ncbi:unnamed protein product [Clonostachys solani]|uniref:Glucose-methanol-choline oxidoreductase N-terminal domain-containing protein n=1 Tax=Clonostachys solani TaxID=160281 RepID=A0A9N9W8E7_9HYPO|nr:unnamed protein product [Clonostachys solani]
MDFALYDYIIVGGGLSGCVLANRLREYNNTSKIVLLEAGKDTRDRSDVRHPQVLNLGGDLDWSYETEPVPNAANRTFTLNSGQGLGGGTAVNSSGWTRGSAIDFDEWAALVKDERYSYAGQLPWFKKCERWLDEKNPEQHGLDGRITIGSAGSNKRVFPLTEKIAEAWDALGAPALPDLDQNAGDNLGRAYICESRLDGQRQWSPVVYPLDGVEVRLEALVQRVVMENSSGSPRATGVELTDGSILSGKEVILCAGALRSPQLLQLSGIGSPTDLKEVGIDAVVDLPDVGKGLTDHTNFWQHWRLRDPSAGYTLGSANPLFSEPQYSKGTPMEWVVTHSLPKEGLATAIEKDEGVKPNPSKHPLLSSARTFSETLILHAKVPLPGIPMDAEHMTTAVINFLPTSRGTVSLKSANIEDHPTSKCPLWPYFSDIAVQKLIGRHIVNMNYLSTEVDKYQMREGIRRITSFMLGPVFSQYVAGETVPDALAVEPVTLNDSDEKLNKRVALAASTTWHYSGTCSMGKVVDTGFRVYGVGGLRVVDASVIPVPLSAHIQAPLYGLTEQAAAIIAGKA